MKIAEALFVLMLSAILTADCYATGENFGSNPSLSQAPRSGYHPATQTKAYLGNLSANQFAPNSTANPFGGGNQFNPNSVNNQFGKYGSRFSPHSVNNPFAVNAPKLYDSSGNYRGKLSSNRFDPDSVSNPFGRYGSRYSPDSINNPLGAGNPLSPDSPRNPFGQGLLIIGE
jgi:hypothetical protein